MTNFSVIGKFRNKEKIKALVSAIRDKGKTCYDFTEKPADPNNPSADAEEQMQVFESTANFQDDKNFKEIFEADLIGLKSADAVILLLPAGTSSHIEAGIAYGLEKKLILIGNPEKAESLYFIFDETYTSIEDFIKTL